MRVAIAGDHAGYDLKQIIIEDVRGGGHEALDLGAHDRTPSDYPDFARAVGEALQTGAAERGIVVCGSGVGACIAVNKMRGVRGALIADVYSAHQGVEHDDMNVICLGARVVGSALAVEVVRAFLGATFQHEERFVRRLNKVLALEQAGQRGS